jgi:ribosome biogenesis protein BRX1
MARERRVSRAQLKAKAASATAAAAGQRDPAFRNRQRTLVVSSRGCTHRDRHVMEDLRFIMPHAKEDSKVDLDNKEGLAVLNEIAELKSANNAVFIEARKNAT